MSKSKKLDIGSMMSFNNTKRESYSLEGLKEPLAKEEKVVRVPLKELSLAPEEWNFYPPLEKEELEELVFSILEHGLLHPIVVRQQGKEMMILSGHNRVRAYEEIQKDIQRLLAKEDGLYLKELGEKELSEYQQIMAVIKENLTDDEAREVIIDANYVQRRLSVKLVTRSIIEKYRIMQDRRKIDSKALKGKKTREVVAEEFQLSGRHIARYKSLEDLNEPLITLFYQGRISLELASKLARLKPKVQDYVAEEYLHLLPKYPSKIASELKPSLTMTAIDAMMDHLELPENLLMLKIRQHGKSSNIVIEDEELMNKILDLVEGL